MIKTKQYPSHEELHELFYYDGENLRWKVDRTANKVKDKIFGYINNYGYRRGKINNKLYFCHKIIWIYLFKYIPHGYEIDHISHDRSDNRIENLRLVTHVENHKNKSMCNDNFSGITGVFWNKRKKKWKASIGINNKAIGLGNFDNKADAYVRRKWALRKYGFHHNHGVNI